MKTYFLLALAAISLLGMPKAFAANPCRQMFQATLDPSIEIIKIIVDGVEYSPDQFLSNMTVKKIGCCPGENTLELSPIKVKLHTNTDVLLSIQFPELKHSTQGCCFDCSCLCVEPSSQTIRSHGEVISDEFIPHVKVHCTNMAGEYKGTLVFTLGVI